MSHYAIIGVLEEQGGLGRWITVHDFAEGPDDNIRAKGRTHNPRTAELKRKLMR